MTSNEEILDALVRHQIGLLRVSGGLRNRVIEQLDAVEADMQKELLSQLARGAGYGSAAKVERLKSMIASIKEIRREAWTQAGGVWRDELITIAKAEPAFMAALFTTYAVTQLEPVLPATSEITKIVRSRPFEGALLSEWVRTTRESDVGRIDRAIKTGIIRGESNASIARRVFGTQSVNGRNGVTALARKNAATITRTAVNHVTNEAREAFLLANQDVVKGVQYLATLDSRTTAVCRGLDGKVYKVGKAPLPPLHLNCRSLLVPALDGNAIGTRPMKSVTRQQLEREWNGKGSFAAFSRRRIRELTGTVPADTTYDQFLRRQTTEVQNDILGNTKARLWRKGGLELEKFVDRDGSELTLSQLARRESEAFTSAGLNPEEFR